MKKHKKLFLCIAGGLAAGFFNGLFGSGGGTLIVPFMAEFLKIEQKKAHATAILIILAFTLVSLIFYGFNSMLDFKLALWVSAGGVFGGFVGAKALSKLSGNVVRKIFGAFMIVAAVKMLMS